MEFPAKLEIVPLSKPPRAVVAVPGSKSITNRALILAALASHQGNCELHGILQSEDTEVMVDCLQKLGFRVDVDWPQRRAFVKHLGALAIIPNSSADLFVANSGTTMRFLTALVSLGHGRYRLDGVPRMRERPIEDLIAALRQLGVRIHSENNDGCPPVIVEADGLRGGTVRMKGNVSSQFLSGLLMAAALADGDVAIEIAGPLVSRPYVDMTIRMLRDFGVEVVAQNESRFVIHGRPDAVVGPAAYRIEPDASAASYFFAAAAITGGEITVPGISSDSIQGDVRFAYVLENMGCQLTASTAGLTIKGGPLHGVDVDMNDISDTVMTLAAVACFADGPTIIRNVAHVRHKETDRLAALAIELRRLGAGVEERHDGLTIQPRPLTGAEVETYNDHRMAMSLALIGLRVSGVVIKNPGCVAKTYPNFFTDLERLRS